MNVKQKSAGVIFCEIDLYEKNMSCRTGRREFLYAMHLFSVYFITTRRFPQDNQWIIVLLQCCEMTVKQTFISYLF